MSSGKRMNCAFVCLKSGRSWCRSEVLVSSKTCKRDLAEVSGRASSFKSAWVTWQLSNFVDLSSFYQSKNSKTCVERLEANYSPYLTKFTSSPELVKPRFSISSFFSIKWLCFCCWLSPFIMRWWSLLLHRSVCPTQKSEIKSLPLSLLCCRLFSN